MDGVDTGKKLLEPQTEQIAEQVLTGEPLSLGYKPSQPGLWMHSQEFMLITRQIQWDVELMLLHDAIAIPLGYYKSGIANVKFHVTADCAEVAQFVERTYRRFWHRSIEQVQGVCDYGWLGGEVMYKMEHGLLQYEGMEDFSPMDVVILTKQNKYRGIDVNNTPKGKTSLWGPGKWPAKALWLTHNRRFNRWYGRSQLTGAWKAWKRLATKDGLEDVLDMAFYRFGVAGPTIRFPPDAFKRTSNGTMDYDAARSRALEITENAKAGMGTALPSTRDDKGNYIWTLDWPAHVIECAGLIEGATFLEKKMSKGIGVSPELFEAADTGSGFSGRKIPLLGFFVGQYMNARGRIRAFKSQVANPLVNYNFGPGHWFEVNGKIELPSELAEESAKQPDQMPQNADQMFNNVPGGEGAANKSQASVQGAPPKGEKPPSVDKNAAQINLSAAEYSLAGEMPDPTPEPEVLLPLWRQILKQYQRLSSEMRTAMLREVQSPIMAASQARAVLQRYLPQFVRLYTDAQLAAALEGMRRVVSLVPVDVRDRLAGTAVSRGPEPDETWRVLDVNEAPNAGLEMVQEGLKDLAGRRAVTMNEFLAMDRAARGKAFTVARVASEEVINLVKDAAVEAVAQGETKQQFVARVDATAGTGTFISPHHAEHVFRDTVNGAYTDGQNKILDDPILSDLFPFRVYNCTHDDRVRPEHRWLETGGLNGTNVYHKDDPVFKMFQPPWDWNCRCEWHAITVRQAAAKGVQVAIDWLRLGAPPANMPRVDPPDFLPPANYLRGAAIDLATPTPVSGDYATVARDLVDLALTNLGDDEELFGELVDARADISDYESGCTFSLATHHAPAGYTKANPLMIAGVPFTGGEFVPGKVIKAATPEELAKLDKHEGPAVRVRKKGHFTQQKDGTWISDEGETMTAAEMRSEVGSSTYDRAIKAHKKATAAAPKPTVLNEPGLNEPIEPKYPQGTVLVGNGDVSFKTNGRTVTFKEGQRLWVTNSQVDQKNRGAINIARDKQGKGYDFSPEDAKKFFSIPGDDDPANDAKYRDPITNPTQLDDFPVHQNAGGKLLIPGVTDKEPAEFDYSAVLPGDLSMMRMREVHPQLEKMDNEHLQGLADYIISKRPDLRPVVDESLADIRQDRAATMFPTPEPVAVPEPTPTAEPVAKPEEKPVGELPPSVALSDTIAEHLKAGDHLSAKDVWAMADEAFGGTRAEGKYQPSEAYDALEAGFNKFLRGNTDPKLDLEAAQAEAKKIADEIEQLPTQTNRSGNKDAFQQFSTPPHYSYACAWLANIKPGEVMLEPSAGTGCLAIQAENAGATVYANELDKDRAAHLRSLFGDDKVHIENAEQISKILPGRGVPAPSVVVMNPPFSQTAGRMGDKKDLMTAAKHIEEAGAMLAPGGRLVAIVGRGMSPDKARYGKWFDKMKEEYSLRANVGVEGDEYKKYGTHFGTRVLVFDKTGPHTGETVTGDAEDIPDLMAKLEGVRNDRATTGASGERAGDKVPGETQGAAGGGNGAASGTGPLVAEGEPKGGLGSAAGSGTVSEPGSDIFVEDADGGLRGTTGGRGSGAGSGSGDTGGTPGRVEGEPEKPKRKRSRRSPSGKSGGQPEAFVSRLQPAAPVEIEAVPEADELTAEQSAEARNSESIFEPYKPARLRIPGEQQHPTKLVESAAMAAVQPPEPTYRPVLAPNVITEGMLTAPALESVVYAGQAHSKFLPSALGDVVQDATFDDPERKTHRLFKDATHNTYHLTGTPLTFADLTEAGNYLVEHKFTNPDGTPIKYNIAYRRGFFIGDGTGAGKGREVSGIIADNWNQGRKKAVWISEKWPLMNDAKRDWRDIGMDPNDIMHFDELRKEKPPAEGIAFITYDTLKGSQQKKKTVAGLQKWVDELDAGTLKAPKPDDGPKKSNVDKLVDWLGKDFDGVIAFDEAHNMGNALDSKGSRGTKEASQKATAGVELQRRLPKARVVYVSATGATEVSNLAYADRLGIWGRGTPFADKGDFIAKMSQGGVASMEAVAQSLKATGAYTARALSYGQDLPDGDPQKVTYDRVEHHLTDDQREQYNAAADAWQVVLKNIDKALKATGGNQSPQAKSAATSQFWGSQQRFFNLFMTSMQTPTVINEMEKDIAAGRAPVVQLVNTMESATDKAVKQKRGDEGEDASLDDLDISPKQLLMGYLENSFPVHVYETYTDDDGNQRSRVATDSEGKPLVSPEAAAMRDEMMSNVSRLRIPESPIDQVVNHFGANKVAEVTGRTQRLLERSEKNGYTKEPGEGDKVLEKRNRNNANTAEANAFQNADKDLLIFSGAGATGRSYHADKNAKNQKQRVHYLLQPGWRADQAVQGFGRTHRTNQASAPLYRLVQINELKGQKRFISSVARRLDQLGALTRGQRQAGATGMFSAADNLESKEANAALQRFFGKLRHGQVDGIPASVVTEQLGFVPNKDGEVKIPEMPQFLNRLLSTRVEMQNAIFGAFEKDLDQTIQQAVREGTLDTGVENVKAHKLEQKSLRTIYTDPESGAKVRLLTVKATHLNTINPWAYTVKQPDFGFVKENATGNVYAVDRWVDKTDAKTGNVISQAVLTSPVSSGRKYVPQADLSSYGGRVTSIKPEEAKVLWEKEAAAAPKTYETEGNYVTGALLPIWDRIPGSHPKIFRVRMDNGKASVGRYVGPRQLKELLQRLGVHEEGKRQHTTAEAHTVLASGKGKAMLSNAWTLKPARVQGEKRIEIKSPNYINSAESRQLQEDGVIVERINYDERYFIPTGAAGVKVLENVTRSRPITEVTDLDGEPISPPEASVAKVAELKPVTPASRTQWRVRNGEGTDYVNGEAVQVGARPHGEFFAHQDTDGDWIVNDAATGLRVSNGHKDKAKAIQQATEMTAKNEHRLEELRDKYRLQ